MKKINFFNILNVMMISCCICWGGDVPYSPVANLTEKWNTNDSQWVSTGNGTTFVIEQALAKSLTAQGVSGNETQIGSITAASYSSGGRFVGDYSNSAITHVVFDVMKVSGAPSSVLLFNSTTGHSWMRNIELPAQSGVWERKEIPITYSAEWTRGTSLANSFIFDQDRSKINEIKIQTTSIGTAQIRIDNFKVVGPWEKGPTIDGEMPIAWLMENSSPNLPVSAGQGGLDADGDGFSNYAEYIAGTGPNDANSQFKIEIGQDIDGKPVVTWNHENYRNYKVFKSSDLTLNGSFKEETGTIQTVGTKNQMPVSEGAASAAFYRVEVDKQ